MNTHQTIRRTLLALATCLVLQTTYAAGRVDLVEGNVSVTTASGQLRIPGKGERIETGDTISTGRGGEIHVHMDDNGLIAVRANSFLKIEAYKAEGGMDDRAVFRLLRGSFRSITGWIGMNRPQQYAVLTPTATVGIRGTDHETLVVTDGTDAGTYDMVTEGETELVTVHGKTAVSPGHAAFAPKLGTEAPKLLTAIPSLFSASANEAVIESSKKTLEDTRDERLKQKRKANERSAVDKDGKPQVGDPEEGRKALAVFESFLRAFEAGDVSQVRQRLNPSMIGYQQLLDNIALGNNECKQMRVHLMNTQVQAGPDLAVVQTSWEKRCLLLPAFTPKMATGKATILLHRGAGEWTFAAITAGNMFDRFAISVPAPVKPPTSNPGTTPVTPPATTPVTPPITTPGTTPVTPPATTPVTPPGTTPVTPPVSPPVTTPVTPPATCIDPVSGRVITCPVTRPVAAPVPAPLVCTVGGRTVDCSTIRNPALCSRRGRFVVCP